MEFIKDIYNGNALEIARRNLAEWKVHAKSDKKSDEFIASLDDDALIRNFAKIIGFGTAGLRGKMIAGSANMNEETVRFATLALAQCIIEAKGSEMGVVIACDSRNNSQRYAEISAEVLTASGIKVFIFESLRPTPELSFAIRELGCKAGINITASHNPSEYNGYKVYWEDGGQLPPVEAKMIADKFYELDFWNIPTLDYKEGVESGKITVIGEEIDRAYLENVLSKTIDPKKIKDNPDVLNILYTPLHGAGYLLAPRALKLAGFEKVAVVEAQATPDGNFPTVKTPNPQFIQSFEEGIKVAGDADIIIANDPDADRMGVALKKGGEYFTLSGNQIALILIDYIIKARKATGTMPENPAIVKSIVSSKLSEVICKRHNVEMFNVYTGFKYIGEKIKEFETSGSHNFLFGFEESYGYLAGTYARDKDGVSAALLIAEAALDSKLRGMTLFDTLDEIYKEYGFWGEYWDESIITNPAFQEEMASIMRRLREEPPKSIAGLKVARIADYSIATKKNLLTGETTPLPFAPENVLTYTLEDESSVTVRPSGTEPKIKLYYFISAENEETSKEKLNLIKAFFNF